MRAPLSTLTLAAVALACGGPSVEPGTPLTEFVYQEQDVPFVNVDDLRAWMEAGNEGEVVFIDNRNSILFQDQRIEGARLVPTDRMDLQLSSLPLNKWLIMYCT
jgi:hypothetical protein